MEWYEAITKFFEVEPWLVEQLKLAEDSSQTAIKAVNKVSAYNHLKLLKLFQKEGVNEFHFQDSTGYGYGDLGRSILENIFAGLFGGVAALVRPQIVSGTHALTLALSALLRPGDTLLSPCGRPYDTLATVIGIGSQVPGNLAEWGVRYAEVGLDAQGRPQWEKIPETVCALKPQVCLIQRSRGYSLRPSLRIEDLERLIKAVKEVNPESICLVDNCYGELVEQKEPGEVGADLVVGSLIKNPGGCLAPSGGYIVGREVLVEQVAVRLTAPGLGGELGSFKDKRLFYQGLYQAPLVVQEALKGAIVAASFFHGLGFAVEPLPDEPRGDIVQCIKLNQKKAVLAFCQGLQKGCPVETGVVPEASPMPGYEEPVIMAGGTFIQGSSIELSADGPLRAPYTVFLQGGQAYPYTRLALLTAALELFNRGLLQGKRR